MNNLHNSEIKDCLLKLVIYYNNNVVREDEVPMGILCEVLDEGDVTESTIKSVLIMGEQMRDTLAILICDTLLEMSEEERDSFVNETVSAG